MAVEYLEIGAARSPDFFHYNYIRKKMIILKGIIPFLIIIEPFEERLDGVTDSLYAYAIDLLLFRRSLLAEGSGSTSAYASKTRSALCRSEDVSLLALLRFST